MFFGNGNIFIGAVFVSCFSDSLKPVWQAIVLLERATRKSPSNFHVKLLLIALYAKLGACAPCCMLFESMEIKHIQHDALG